MGAILGIDAAWTSHHPSGIALIRRAASEGWECVAVDHSYEAFLRRSNLRLSDRAGGKVPVESLLQAAEHLAGTTVNLVAADIPLAVGPINGRRYADDKISRLFGGRGCSTHSPSATRPGRVSEEIRDGFRHCGFHMATRPGDLTDRALIETYPHPALLALLNAKYRVPYKACNSMRYWRNSEPHERRAKIIVQLELILEALKNEMSGIDFETFRHVEVFSNLKPVEDKIDALVCAWVGMLVLEGRALPVGDADASIWVPVESLPNARPEDWSDYLRQSE